MGLDIHVMRPKRFFMRDFELPVQRLLPGVEIRGLGTHPMTTPVKSDYGYLGSTPRLRRELDRLSAVTHKAGRHRETVIGAIAFLQQAIDGAEQSHLPVIFDG